MSRLGSPSFRVGQVITHVTYGTLTVLEVFSDTESGVPAYLCDYTDADSQSSSPVLREIDLHAFTRGDGLPRGMTHPRRHFDELFWWVNAPAAYPERIPDGPCRFAATLVPEGWVAHLELITLATYRSGVDITLATGVLHVGTAGNIGVDKSAEFGALTVEPASYGRFGHALPLVGKTYIIAAPDEDMTFSLMLTTNGTSGTLDAYARVKGYMYEA